MMVMVAWMIRSTVAVRPSPRSPLASSTPFRFGRPILMQVVHQRGGRNRRWMMSELSRAVLPIPDQTHVGLTTYDAKDPDTSYPPIEALRPPTGAPNVVVVLLDDVGFGAASAFGGPCHT